MRKFYVKYVDAKTREEKIVEAEDQAAAMIEVMREHSPDGIRAPQCSMLIRPEL